MLFSFATKNHVPIRSMLRGGLFSVEFLLQELC